MEGYVKKTHSTTLEYKSVGRRTKVALAFLTDSLHVPATPQRHRTTIKLN